MIIYASALYLTDGKTEIVIVSLDLIGLFYDDVESCRIDEVIKSAKLARLKIGEAK